MAFTDGVFYFVIGLEGEAYCNLTGTLLKKNQ